MKHHLAVWVILLLAGGSSLTLAQQKEIPSYKNAELPIDQRVKDLLGRMTLEEKFWQLFMIPGDLSDGKEKYIHGIFGLNIRDRGDRKPDTDQMLDYTDSGVAGKTAERINEIQKFFVEETRLGIPIIPFDEALHGLLRQNATAFPQSIALAATWDVPLMKEVAAAIAREARSRGLRDVLSPVVNIARDPRWGRVEETYGEDPYLSSRMGAAFVRSFEDLGIVTTPKHFVANVGDGGRDSYPIDMNERQMEEVYFPPFEACFRDGHASSVMTAYNSLDGVPCTANKWLLEETLKKKWGFEGFVISDAAAVGGILDLHHTVSSREESAKSAIEGGLDVIFQTDYDHHVPLLKAFTSGMIDQKRIDDAVARVLRAKFRLGLFEHPYVDPAEAEKWNGNAAHRKLALKAAQEAIVLLKNDQAALPLKKSIRSLAVIGEDAAETRLGGYSGAGIRPVSILTGIRKKLGEATLIRYARGCSRIDTVVLPIAEEFLRTDQGAPGLLGEYFNTIDLSGNAVLTRVDKRVDFSWTLFPPDPSVNADWFSVRWTGKVKAPQSGTYTIGIDGDDGCRLYLDGRLVIDRWMKQQVRTTTVPFRFEEGKEYAIRLECKDCLARLRCRLVWNVGVPDEGKGIDAAVELVQASDAAVIVAGLEEGEFRDRAELGLPGRQEELIRRVAATGKPTVVVIVGGSAVTMSSWFDSVKAIVDVWYAGEEGGTAAADVLFGDYNPGGRLPLTFPQSVAQVPLYYNHKPTGRGDDYDNMTGKPLFPFGFGLSYSSFVYSDLSITPTGIGVDGTVVVRCNVKNTGTAGGDEVVQLYIKDLVASTVRPVMELKAFERVTLMPGETRQVSFTLAATDVALLNERLERVVEPGEFKIMIGSSSEDIRLKGEMRIVPGR